MVRDSCVESQKALEFTKQTKNPEEQLLKFLCILSDILKSQAQNGIHQDVFLVDDNKSSFLITFITLVTIIFQKIGKMFPEFLP